MAVTSIAWVADSPHRLDNSVSEASNSEMALSLGEDLKQTTLYSNATVSRSSSGSTSSVCPSSLIPSDPNPVRPSFKSSWVEHASSSLKTWHSWELPIPLSHEFWTECNPKNVGELPVLHQWRHQASGLAPELLSLLATLPRSGPSCVAAGVHLHCFFRWDAWMKMSGTDAEALEFGRFFDLQTRLNLAPGVDLALFPKRLRQKFPLKAEQFLNSMLVPFPQQDDGLACWFKEYSSLWRTYAGHGLLLHRKIRKLHEANRTAEPSEFLVYRALTSGFPLVALLAARQKMDTAPHPAALEAAYPLLALGSMVAATFSDLMRLHRSTHRKQPSVSSTDMFDDEWTVSMHNSLLALFHEEAGSLLQQALDPTLNPPTVSRQVVTLVAVIKAALHGMVLWSEMAPLIAGPGLETSDGNSSGVEQTFAQQDIGNVLSREVEHIPAPTKDIIDAAVDYFVNSLKSEGPL